MYKILSILAVFFLPVTTRAADLVTCTGFCGTCEFLQMLHNVLFWLTEILFYVAVLFTIVIGGLLAVPTGNEGLRSMAKRYATSAITGFVIVLSAVIVVDLFLKAFVPSSDIGGYFNKVQCLAPDSAPTPTVPVRPDPVAVAKPEVPVPEKVTAPVSGAVLCRYDEACAGLDGDLLAVGIAGTVYEAAIDESVVAIAKGIVISAGAGVVVVAHADGTEATYGHVDASESLVGTTVSPGDALGTAANFLSDEEREHYALNSNQTTVPLFIEVSETSEPINLDLYITKNEIERL